MGDRRPALCLVVRFARGVSRAGRRSGRITPAVWLTNRCGARGFWAAEPFGIGVTSRMLSSTKMSPFWPGGLLLLLIAITTLLFANAASTCCGVIHDAPVGGAEFWM